MSQIPPPPAFIQKDDYSAADLARKRLVPKSRFTHFLSLPNLRTSNSKQNQKSPEQLTDTELQPQTDDLKPIKLDASQLNDEGEYKDKYEWAIVYENQRGCASVHLPELLGSERLSAA